MYLGHIFLTGTIFLDSPNLKKIPHPIPSTSTRLELESDGEFDKPNSGIDQQSH